MTECDWETSKKGTSRAVSDPRGATAHGFCLCDLSCRSVPVIIAVADRKHGGGEQPGRRRPRAPARDLAGAGHSP
jgi:hypothetical protein